MKVFKFGGASVKNAAAVRNVIRVLQETDPDEVIIVVSAMGKITNALEKVVDHYIHKSPQLNESIGFIGKFHQDILTDLFEQPQHPIFGRITSLINDMRTTIDRNKSTQYDYLYDQVICYGELISSQIISAYLEENGYTNTWIDAREFIKTNTIYRDATVQWQQTQQAIDINIPRGIVITQGFIGSDKNNFATTLGREGSDYTAAIIAYCMSAESVTVWKDVPGILNGDPKVFKDTVLLTQISYEEAIELAFYGASIIHPKTLQPLQRKEIPLYVRSFLHPSVSGTTVQKGQYLTPHVACYIVKKNQILLSLYSLDFSFIVEDAMSDIFKLLHKHQLKVDLIQNSAISFSVCLNDKFNNFESVLPLLKAKFEVTFEKNVSLYTIRHFTTSSIWSLEQNLDILLKQSTKETYQAVVKEY